MKRTKQLIIRVNESEYQELLKRKSKIRLAEWMREVCLDKPIRKTVKVTDPKLLYELARIGGNLNQLAKKINLLDNFDSIALLTELAIIRNQINNIFELSINHDSKNIQK